jgi:hypothetical protein
MGFTGRDGRRTALLAAQRRLPSLATVTLDMLTSGSGSRLCEQVFSARSHTFTVPARSQLMISPWLGCITTSLTGAPCR